DAYGLLIPLRPTDQDRARFPHKIGEYCGASRPVITTNIGEIAYRFTNGLNAFVAEHYDLAEYAAAIEDCLSDPSRADAVGAAGRVIAEEVHHYGAFAPHFKRFVLEVLARYRSKRLRARVPYPLDEDSPAPKTGKEAKRRLRAQPPPRTTPR
ncbi:MAG TPA: glycosyltransferase, partial [Bacteroidota bacterium]